MNLLNQDSHGPAKRNPADHNLAAHSGFRDLMPGVKLPDMPPIQVRQLVLWMVVCGFGLFGGLVFLSLIHI